MAKWVYLVFGETEESINHSIDLIIKSEYDSLLFTIQRTDLRHLRQADLHSLKNLRGLVTANGMIVDKEYLYWTLTKNEKNDIDTFFYRILSLSINHAIKRYQLVALITIEE